MFTVKHAGKRLSGWPRGRREDNIKMNLKEMCQYEKLCFHSAQYRDYWRVLVNAALKLRFT